MPRTKLDTEFNHVYPLPSGRYGFGATTVLSCLHKPLLLNWAGKVNREAIYDYLRENWDAVPLGLDQIRAATDKPHHTLAVKSAADIGSYAHKLCEAFVSTRLGTPTTVPDSDRLTQPQRAKANHAYGQFVAWADAHRVKFLGTELRVAYEEQNLVIHFDGKPHTFEEATLHPRHRYGGTVDLLTERDGGHFVDDIKTSGAVYGSHGLQVLAYAKAANHSKLLGFTDWQAGSIVRLPKTEKDADVEVVSALDAIRREWSWLDLDSAWSLFLSLCDVCYAVLGDPKGG